MSEFERAAAEVLGTLQSALRATVSRFGDPGVIRPVDLRDILGVDMNLAWKISRLVNTTDLFSIGRYLPGKKALGVFRGLCADAGVPAAETEALAEATEALNRLVRSYAGSRKELEVMLAGLSTQERPGNDTLHRRKSFEGNCYTFGVQSDRQLAMNILLTSHENPETVDICRVRGSIGLFRTRPDVPWRVGGTSILDSSGRVRGDTRKESLFPGSPGEPPLIREYSSRNLPEFGEVTDSEGRRAYFLKGKEMGLKSSMDLFTGEVIRQSGHLYSRGPGQGVALNNSSRTPTRSITVELYLPPEFSESSWEVEMWSLLFPVHDHTGMTPGDRLALTEQPLYYGPGRSPVPLAGVPRYCELAKECFIRLGERIEEYGMLRLTVDFPPIPASIDYLVELPERPS